ncbi:snRNA-activating protein complex subunit 3-like [Ischnura elegans]|uniref:snRNA-activating protein complex subunit 3-like n=1 Tax=Ischnura elegans TaxID=197161 RepID=UPI001ED89EA6|nr:snRNA-activating protein complex subunit 3-like [Ischnura elegans]
MHRTYASLDVKWVSKEFNTRSLLLELNQNLKSCHINPSTPVETISTLMDQDVTEEKVSELAQSCSIEKFNFPNEPSAKLPPKAKDGSCISYPITEEGKSKLATLRTLSSTFGKYHDSDSAVALPRKDKMRTSFFRSVSQNQEAVKEINLKPLKHVVVTVRVYHPFQQKYGARRKMRTTLAQKILLLGEQPLTDLRDILFCVNDYAVPGDRSENVDEEVDTSNKEIYPSAYFFIENTFFNDMRNPLSKDLSLVVREWMKGLPGDFEDITAKPMDTAKLEDLNIRLGYPYVFVHQGSCEHLIVFSDARLINSSDSLCSADYPNILYLYKKYSVLCNFCGNFTATWILTACDRVPYKMVHLCESCLKMYCYKGKEKVGKFRLYEYIDPSSIAPETFVL